ncbi:MAG: ABC-F family ATP-binding cassette domain-containing protein [Acidobacteria bacterium]|nr:ABC-F family ATP-binding cassette domain-containing protein [Acidobacteriota bacterium]
MLFRLSEVNKSYGTQDVLKGAGFQINPGEHAGLVGRNGAGKTTILRLIAGVETPDTGEVDRLKGLKLGVLSQHVDFIGSETLLDAALHVFEKLISLEKRMRDLEHAMTESSGDLLEKVMLEYSEAQHIYEDEGGFSYHARAESVLLGLGFNPNDFAKKAEDLSGGEKNRLGLARLLLLEPDILLLDEPTNHLDVEAVEWLEDFLSAYKSAFLIISHDRFFLDHTVNRVLDLENGQIDSYKGNYSDYLIQKEERREQQVKAYEQQQELISKTEDFIRRNLAGQKTKQAKSRRKMLEKMDRVENLNNLETANFKLKPTARTGDQVMILEKLSIGYPSQTLAKDLTFTLRRGERLGIIGGNGTGKTTLLRTILGELRPIAGDLRFGSGVSLGYYDQRLLSVDERNTVIEDLRTVASSSVTDGELRGFLGRFLFSGDDAYKPVSALSGGEKGRLAIAKLIYSRANVLMLDEPTNHLDIASCEALEEALNVYDGTIITVSHDRYFLDRVATNILFFGEKGVEYFNGGYTEFYESHHRALADEQARVAEALRQEKTSRKTVAPKTGSTRKSKKKQVAAAEIETQIHSTEAEFGEIAELISTEEVARDRERLQELSEKYHSLEDRLKDLYQKWEQALETESQAAQSAS